MKELHRRAWTGLSKTIIGLPILIFLPAGTVAYWQGWACVAVFSVSAIWVTLYLMKTDPALLERRMSAGVQAEKERTQKIVQIFASIAFIAMFVVPALDHRFGWSHVPVYVEVCGDLLTALGFLMVFFVFRVNSYTSGIIEIADGQGVITTGSYARVRHPMYSGALVMLMGIPLALGSWWGGLALAAMAIVIILRLLNEEKFLSKSLPGYAEYLEKVRYRLVPGIW
jgi:protein-S-isoprenylcysteine O-methyltransferase Ste14